MSIIWSWTAKSKLETSDSVSVLAIVETIAAAGVYAVLAAKFGTLHLSVSACIAPLLLLRTEHSTQLGLRIGRMFGKLLARLDVPKGNFWYVLSATLLLVLFIFLVLVPLIALAALAARVAGTLGAATAHPIQTLIAVPRNWWNFVARIDSTTVPEAIPGTIASKDRNLNPFNIPQVLNAGMNPGNTGEVILGVLFVPWYVLLVFIPTLLYRWSVKGTALIYSPMIYVAHSAFSGPLKEQLRDIRELAIHRIARIYALLVIFLFAAKMALFFAWTELGPAWQQIPARQLLEAYVVPQEIPPWQLASFVNALLAWIVFIVADFVTVRLSRPSGWTDVPAPWMHMTQTLRFVRGILTIYTITCVLYISVSLIPELDWPPLGSKLFPW